MIITTGSIVKILTVNSIELERTAETPGSVSVMFANGAVFCLPGNPEDAHAFIAAYRRIVEEPIEYRKVVVE